MYLLDPEIGDCRALIVDGNPTSRSILSATLRDFGVGHVTQCSRMADARRMLEVRDFDLVLCEQFFHDDDYSGQDLLDDLRRANMLPYSTVFVMITGEATYASVAEAAESALDGYLLKPYTTAALADRIKQARHRKRVLKDVFTAIESNRIDQATRLCLVRFKERAPYGLYCARIGAELLLRSGNAAMAQKLYETVLQLQPLPWARLGMARTLVDTGQPLPALKALEQLAIDEPEFIDALDLLGRLQLEHGRIDAALETYWRAADKTPGSIERVQRQGLLAFYLGHYDESARLLDRAVALGITSKMFDPQCLLLLGVLRWRQRDIKGFQRCMDNLAHAARTDAGNTRLERFVRVLRVLEMMMQRQIGAVAVAMDELAGEIRADGFDMEAACNFLTLLAHLIGGQIRLEQTPAWVETLGLRFCTSKGAAELLAGAADAHPATAEALRQAHGRVLETAEQAMSLKMKGDPRSAVKSLVASGGRMLNAKLIEMAGLTLQRYRAQIADADMMAPLIDDLRQRHPAHACFPPMGLPRGRQLGGLRLRVDAPAPDAASAPAAAAAMVSTAAATAPAATTGAVPTAAAWAPARLAG